MDRSKEKIVSKKFNRSIKSKRRLSKEAPFTARLFQLQYPSQLLPSITVNHSHWIDLEEQTLSMKERVGEFWFFEED